MATKKNNKKKLLIVGGILLVGVGGYFLLKNHQATTVPATTPTGDTTTGGGSTGGGSGITSPISAQPNPAPSSGSTSGSAVVNMQQALLNWSVNSQNPPLYQQWIRSLTDQQTAGMYDILENYWSGKAPETSAQMQTWNALVGQYPFLRTGGLKSSGQPCNDFNCAT